MSPLVCAGCRQWQQKKMTRLLGQHAAPNKELLHKLVNSQRLPTMGSIRGCLQALIGMPKGKSLTLVGRLKGSPQAPKGRPRGNLREMH